MVNGTILCYGARYYDPQLGRFIQPDWIIQDPSDPQFLNRYTYCRDNPIRYTDPTGNFIPLIFGAAAAFAAKVAVGALIGAAVGAAIGAADAAINGRNIGQGALNGLKMGAKFGAIISGAYAIAAALPGGAALFAKTGIDLGLTGLSAHSAVKNFEDGNYFMAAVSAVGVFYGAKQLRNDFKNIKSQGFGNPRNPGTGNRQVDAKLEQQQQSALAKDGVKVEEVMQRDDFFRDAEYTPKVQRQMAEGNYHGFPENVTFHQDLGKITTFKGGDGNMYQRLEIRGSYNGRDGTFEFIKNGKGEINHRMFRSDWEKS